MDVNDPGFQNLPSFLAETQCKNPTDLQKSNWQSMKNTEANFFQWMALNPQIEKNFQNVMMAYSASKPSVAEIFPMENLMTDWKQDRPLFVDVGGSSGHDIENLRLRYRDLPSGSLVLQDLEGPIQNARTQEPIKAMVHDILTPQPIKGE